METFEVKTEGNQQYLVCKLPLAANPPLSQSGKTRVSYTTNGFRQGVAVVNGKPLAISINVTAPKA